METIDWKVFDAHYQNMKEAERERLVHHIYSSNIVTSYLHLGEDSLIDRLNPRPKIHEYDKLSPSNKSSMKPKKLAKLIESKIKEVGGIFGTMGNVEQLIELHSKLERLPQGFSHKNAAALSRLYLEAKDVKKSAEYMRKARDLGCEVNEFLTSFDLESITLERNALLLEGANEEEQKFILQNDARTYFHLGNYDKALEYMQGYDKLDPQNLMNKFLMGELSLLKHDKKGEDYLKQFIAQEEPTVTRSKALNLLMFYSLAKGDTESYLDHREEFVRSEEKRKELFKREGLPALKELTRMFVEPMFKGGGLKSLFVNRRGEEASVDDIVDMITKPIEDRQLGGK